MIGRRSRVVACTAVAAVHGVMAASAASADVAGTLTDPPSAAAEDGGAAAAPGAAVPFPQAHAYTLAECLTLVDRNHPNLWAARARLAQVHAQLDEVTWAPFSNFTAQAGFGVLPPITGSALYTASTPDVLSTAFGHGYAPFFHFELNGNIPLYTFGKIASARRAGEAAVRVSEWDFQKVRSEARWDVRRAYFGLMMARDARYVVDEIVSALDTSAKAVADKIAAGDTTVSDADRLRLEVYREEVFVRGADAQKGGDSALAALRFLTGVQSGFDIPDRPLKRPDRPVVALAQYLEAARLFRPEVNMARAGVAARRALVDLQRARFFPDLGVAFFSSYSTSPSAVQQRNAWIGDPFNRFVFGALFGARWSLDVLPNQARVEQAESQLEEVRALERFALGGVGTEVEAAYASVVECKTREETWDRAEHKAKQWLATVKDAIDLGSKEEKDLVEPLKAYASARAQHLVSLFDLNREMCNLAKVSGWDSSAPEVP